jgi:hypothetical protein
MVQKSPLDRGNGLEEKEEYSRPWHSQNLMVQRGLLERDENLEEREIDSQA